MQYFYRYPNGITIPAEFTLNESIDKARQNLKAAAHIASNSKKDFKTFELEIVTGNTPGIEAKNIKKITTITVDRELKTSVNLEELESYLTAEQYRPEAIKKNVEHQREINAE